MFGHFMSSFVNYCHLFSFGMSVDLQQQLENTGNLITQTITRDIRTPDIPDLLEDNRYQKQYFIEPYSNQQGYTPQLLLESDIPLPDIIKQNKAKRTSFLGFFKEINRCWITIDCDLYVWNYYTNELSSFSNDVDGLIVSVGLVRPKKDVFRDDILYLLVVSTPVEIVILGLSFEDGNIEKEMYIHKSPFCVPTNNVNMISIDGTDNGRIFLGGSNGYLHELVYENQDKSSYFGLWKNCRLVNLSYSYLTLLPPFFFFSSQVDPIYKVVVDKERNLLYTLSAQSVITLYDLGDNCDTFRYVDKCNDIRKISFLTCQRKDTITSFPKKDTFSKTDTSVIQMTSISVLSTRSSNDIHLVAVSRQGIRFYFYSGTFVSGRKVRDLHLCDIRMPPVTISYEKDHIPEYIALAEGTPNKLELQNIRLSYVNNDVCIMINGSYNEKDTLIGLTRDFIVNRFKDTNQQICYSESMDVTNDMEKIYDISSITSDSILPKNLTTNENINQYLDSSQKYLLLTRSGIKVYQRVLPAKQLLNICSINQSNQEEAIDRFFSYFGSDEACTMCIRLACQTNISDQQLREKIIDYFISRGGNACFSNSCPVQINQKTVVGPNLLHSNKYNSLVNYFARIISPFWDFPLFDVKTKQFKYEYQQLNQINSTLLQLITFFSNCESSGNYDLVNYACLGNEESQIVDAVSRENRDIYNLKTIAVNTQQFIKQLIIYYYKENNINEIFKRLDTTVQNDLCNLPLVKVISTNQAQRIFKSFIQGYMEYTKSINENNKLQIVSKMLREHCAYYYSDQDVSLTKGRELLTCAEAVTGNERMNYFQQAYQCFIDSASKWNYSQTQNLFETICREMTKVEFYEGVLSFTLAVAHFIANGNVTVLPPETTEDEPTHNRINCYNILINIYKQLIIDGKKEFCEKLINKSIQTCDKLYHFSLYKYLLDEHRDILIRLNSTPYIADYLLKTDKTLLYNYFIQSEEYGKAAQIMIELAYQDNQNFSDRLSKLSNALRDAKISLSNSKNDGLTEDQVIELDDRLEIAHLQYELIQLFHNKIQSTQTPEEKNRYQQGLTELQTTIRPASDLYTNYARKYHFYESSLCLLKACNVTDESLIVDHWKKYIKATKTPTLQSITSMRNKILTLGRKLHSSNNVFFPVNHICLLLEEYSSPLTSNARYPVTWVIDMFIAVGIRLFDIYTTYSTILRKQQSPKWSQQIIKVIIQILQKWAYFVSTVECSDFEKKIYSQQKTRISKLINDCTSLLLNSQEDGKLKEELSKLMTYFL